MRQLVVSALARRGAPSLTLRSSSSSGTSTTTMGPRALATSPLAARPRAAAAAAATARRSRGAPHPPPRASAAAAASASPSSAVLNGPVPWPGAPEGDLDARPTLSILRYPDPRLRAPNVELGPAAFAAGPNARRLADLARAMTELMYELSNDELVRPVERGRVIARRTKLTFPPAHNR
jgi:hypothetical protein